jgi:multicomponent Na+:H+ antiporter subunit E
MFLFNILLAVTWGMATGMFTVSNLAFGYALGYLILRFAQRVLGPSPYFTRAPQVLAFVLRYLWELVLANFRVAYDVLVPGAGPTAGRVRVTPRRPARAADGAGGAPRISRAASARR